MFRIQKTPNLMFATGGLLSAVGWLLYSHFVYITSKRPDYTIAEYNEKFFSGLPFGVDTIDRANLATVIMLAIAIMLVAVTMTMRKKSSKVWHFLIVINGIVIGMVGFAYM